MIKKIKLQDFRLFSSLELDVNHPLVILSGRNATGKTSVLEAIYLCATSKSHRTQNRNEVIRSNQDFSKIEVKSNKDFKVVLSKGSRAFFINNKEYKKVHEFIGNLNVVMFSPSDLYLVEGSKAERRRFLDLEISLLDKAYLNTSMVYKRLLTERNELLKAKSPDMILLNVLTESLIEALEVIYNKRIEFLSQMNILLNDICRELEFETIRLEYSQSFSPTEIKASFDKKLRLDLALGSTSIGIHRDDFIIKINDQLASAYASEGQKRSICLAIKLALKRYIENVTSRKIILLLDDIFAALDSKRIESITRYIKNSSQSFITTTSILEIPDDILKDSLVIRM